MMKLYLTLRNVKNWDFDYSDYYDENHRVKKVAWSTSAKRKVHVDDAITHRTEFSPYFDLESNEEVLPRKCYDKTNHFAFKPQETPIVSAKESELHKQCIQEILDVLLTKVPGGKWAKERGIGSRIGKHDLIPDISGRIFKD